jgi:L-lactate dehydrogenase
MMEFDEMNQLVRDIGFTVFTKKGATFYAIAAALARITRAIFRDENTVLPVSCYLDGEYGEHDIYTGVPAVINREGVRELVNLYLDEEDMASFHDSCESLRENFDAIKSEI